jgi:hypothetical protein
VVLSATAKGPESHHGQAKSVHGGPVYAGEIEPLTFDEYLVLRLGFLPGERDLELRLFATGSEQAR